MTSYDLPAENDAQAIINWSSPPPPPPSPSDYPAPTQAKRTPAPEDFGPLELNETWEAWDAFIDEKLVAAEAAIDRIEELKAEIKDILDY